MPELPEVEAVVRALREDGIERARLQRAHILRPGIARPQAASEVERLTSGVTVRSVERCGKNILLDLSNGITLHIHLRMTGDLLLRPSGYEPEGAVRAEWDVSRKRRLLFEDRRALGRVHALTAEQRAAVLSKLGTDPLSAGFTTRWLGTAVRSSRLPAKLFLMDQTKIAGIGNIYASEALFRARISPFRRICSIGTKEVRALRDAIRETLNGAVHSVYKAYRSPGGYRQHKDDFERKVYGRKGEPCVRCKHPIERAAQGGRSTFYCPHCQL